jgi:hypothetical protein
MKHLARIVVLFCAVFCGAWAKVAIAAPQVEPVSDSMSIERRPQFCCVGALLQRIVDDAASRGPQSLYIGPIEQEGDAVFMRVYWPQAHAILLIDWPASCRDEDMRIDDAALGWYRTKARIDLETEVVPTPEDIAGSTYLVDRPWVDRVVAACRRGHLLVIEPGVRDSIRSPGKVSAAKKTLSSQLEGEADVVRTNPFHATAADFPARRLRFSIV